MFDITDPYSRMVFLDPPQHSRLRKLLNKGFTPKMIQRLRPGIKQIVEAVFYFGPKKKARY